MVNNRISSDAWHFGANIGITSSVVFNQTTFRHLAPVFYSWHFGSCACTRLCDLVDRTCYSSCRCSPYAATHVQHGTRHCSCSKERSDEQIPAYARIISAVHKYDAQIGVQIGHAGRKAQDAAQPVGASDIPIVLCPGESKHGMNLTVPRPFRRRKSKRWSENSKKPFAERLKPGSIQLSCMKLTVT